MIQDESDLQPELITLELMAISKLEKKVGLALKNTK